MTTGTSRLGAAMGVTTLALLMTGCAGLPVTGPEPRGAVRTLKVDETEAQALISAYRRSHGLGEVVFDPALERVAQRQADVMASADALSHTVGGALPDRLAAMGAERPAAVENVSAGYSSLQAALGGWRRSPPHDANLLFGPMRRMGIAAATAPDTRYKTFWALVMTN